MPPDQKTTQNQNSETNSILPSPQVPIADVPISVTVSEPSNMPLEAPESPKNVDNTVPVNNDNPENTPETTENKAEIAENGQNTEKTLENTKPEESPLATPLFEEIPPVSAEPVKAPETPTAQTPVSEPLSSASEPFEDTQNKPLGEQVEKEVAETKLEPVKEETKQTETKISEPKIITESKPVEKPEPVEAKPIPVLALSKPSQKNLWQRFLAKVQIGKRKKLEKIMSLFLKHKNITNDEVEKYLHVSDATATRYLSILEKENKIKQNGKTGHTVSYSRI